MALGLLSQTGSGVAIVIDACVAQHQGDRAEQQDRVAMFAHPRQPGVALAVVADGMGGRTGGALAAEQVLYTAKSSLEHFFPAENSPPQLIEGSLREAHTLIKTSRFINEKEPHSTAVLLLLQPGLVSWGHCGDSRLYHFRGGQLLRRTVDHSYVEHLVATGKITAAEALQHPHRNVLLAALGGKDEPRISLGMTAALLPGDAFVLCSDGLWAYLEDEEFGALVAANPARRACELLIELARQRAAGGGDNISLAVIKFERDSPRPRG